MQTFGLQAVRWFTHFTHTHPHPQSILLFDQKTAAEQSLLWRPWRKSKQRNHRKQTMQQAAAIPWSRKNCEATQPTLGELSKSETDYTHTCTPANTTQIFTRYAFWKQRWTAATRAAKNRILSSFYLSNLKRPPGLPLYHHHVETFRCNRKIQRIVTAPPPPTQGDWTTT